MGELAVNRRTIAVFAGISIILFSFQNCGRSGFQAFDDAELLSASLTGTNPGGKASAPLAFEIGLDSIAYNSCVPNVKGAAGYFTLKATAAGNRGGVRLSNEFLSTAASTLRPVLGNSQVIDVQYKELIEKTNANLELQVALRSVTDMRAAYTGSVKGGVWGSFDYLTDDSWMTPLVASARRQSNAWVGYSNRAPSNKSRLDFSFNQDFAANDYWSSLLGTQAFRACTAQGCQGYGQFHIAVGFSEEQNRSLIKSPVAYTTAQTKAYGRGYQLQYGYPNNNPNGGMRVVKAINEYDLATGTPIVEGAAPAQWKCLEIPIMSANQRGNASYPQTSSVDNRIVDTTDPSHFLCNPMSGGFAVQSYNQMNLAKIREILPPNQWQLGYQNVGGASRLCVVPIGMDCYPNENFPNFQINGNQLPYPYYVEYETSRRCINEDNMAAELTRADQSALNAVCAHYITVCTKQ